MKTHLRHWLAFLCILAVSSCASPPAKTTTSVPPQKRILILISLDAFRWDYLQKYHPTNLNRLATKGVHAERMISMFPSLTFPNHTTIMTGLRPEHHGIINNNMYDPATKETFSLDKTELQGPEWWGGEPIWATAIKQGRTADCLFWPGTGITMAGVLPTEWKRYDAKPEPNEIVDMGLAWLDQPPEKRPSVLVLYFHHTDTVGHKYGPNSPEIAASVAQVDAAMGRLVDGIHRLNLDDTANIVIVSDHGMTEVSTNRLIELSDYVDLGKVQVDFSGAVGGLRPLDGNVDALYARFAGKQNHFHVYRREDMPAEYHYRDNPRIPEIMLVADEGWYISKRATNAPPRTSFEKGTHGFDPRILSMGATFIAWGPAFQHGVTIAPFENVHVYNLLCATLGLQPAPNDGDDRLVKEVLAR